MSFAQSYSYRCLCERKKNIKWKGGDMHQKERKQVQGRCRIADAGTDLVSSCPLQHVLFCAVLYYLHHLTSFFSLSTLLCPMPRPSPFLLLSPVLFFFFESTSRPLSACFALPPCWSCSSMLWPRPRWAG